MTRSASSFGGKRSINIVRFASTVRLPLPPTYAARWMLIIAANTALGLYGGGWRTRLCGADVAARLVGPEYAAVELADAPAAGSPPDTAVWAAVDREPDGGGILPGLLFEPHIARDGLPDAVARLRPQRGLIDSLVLSVPRKTAGRENPEWHEAAAVEAVGFDSGEAAAGGSWRAARRDAPATA